MQSDRTITVGDQTLEIRYGQNGLYLIDQELCRQKNAGVLKPRTYTYTDPKTKKTSELEAPVMLEDLFFLPRRLSTQIGLWAGLESARRKNKTRLNPWTIEEVGDLIDEAGGFQNIEATVVEAFKAAFPQYFPEPEKTEGEPEKNEPEETPAIGTRSSRKPSKPASA